MMFKNANKVFRCFLFRKALSMEKILKACGIYLLFCLKKYWNITNWKCLSRITSFQWQNAKASSAILKKITKGRKSELLRSNKCYVFGTNRETHVCTLMYVVKCTTTNTRRKMWDIIIIICKIEFSLNYFHLLRPIFLAQFHSLIWIPKFTY